jgi:hypothetical protein
VDAEGCFYVNVSKNKAMNSGYAVSVKLEIAQHTRDIELLHKIVEFLGCGSVFVGDNKTTASVHVLKIADLLNIIIPLFGQYPLQGVKRVNFEDFCRIVYMMQNKEHLNTEGVQTILGIKEGMNTKRIYEQIEIPADQKVLNDNFSTRHFLYDAATLNLIKIFATQRDLIAELKMSSHTVLKYCDTGRVVRGKYLIASVPMSKG